MLFECSKALEIFKILSSFTLICCYSFSFGSEWKKYRSVREYFVTQKILKIKYDFSIHCYIWKIFFLNDQLTKAKKHLEINSSFGWKVYNFFEVWTKKKGEQIRDWNLVL